MDLKKIGLGTVQIGLNYGVSNLYGKPGVEEIQNIFDAAVQAKIGFIDTAPAYGNAEETIGGVFPNGCPFKVISKTPVLVKEKFNKADRAFVIDAVKSSLSKLNLSSIYGILLHNPDCLFRSGREYIIDALQTLKAKGLVKKIGVSVYDEAELDQILKQFLPDIIQLPLSPLDQRLIRSGHIDQLKHNDVEVHVRSIFLQGLLLMEPHKIPKPLIALTSDIVKFQDFVFENEMTPLSGCLMFGLQNNSIDVVVVGSNNSLELSEIITSVKTLPANRLDFSNLASDRIDLLNPASWQHG